MSKGLGEQHINSEHVHRQACAYHVLTNIPRGFAHAAVIGQQRLRSLSGERFEHLGLHAQEAQRLLQLAGRRGRVEVGAGTSIEQRSGFGWPASIRTT
jgi:hypothetical protein